MQQFSIGDRQFRAEGLGPKKAFHVARRLAPMVALLQELAPYFTGAKQFDPEDPACIREVLEPIGNAFAEMPEADVDYVIDTCCAATSLKLDGDAGWAPIMAGDRLMYDWIDMPMMLQIVWRVAQQNVAGFLSAGASAS